MRMHLPGLCLALALGVPSMAGAQGGPRGVELDLNSRYLWRGIPYSDGPVLQPYVWLTVDGTEASVWSSLETGTGPTPWQPNQLFFTLTRTYAKGAWHVAPTLQGYTWRGAPGEPGARTLEVAARVTRPLGAVTFVTVHTVDIASYHGAYVADAGVEHRRVAGPWTVDASALVSWANGAFNRTYVGTARASLDNVQFSAAATRPLPRRWYVRPHAEAVWSTDGDVARALGRRARASAGVSAGREF